MLKPGPAKKVTIYLGEDTKHGREPLYLAVLNFLFQHGVSGATVTKGVAGFGVHHHMHTTRILDMSGNLPVKVEFVEDPAALDAILPQLVQLVSPGLVDVQDTTVVSSAMSPDRRS